MEGRLPVCGGANPRLPFESALPAIGALIAANADGAGRAADALSAGFTNLRDAESGGDGRCSEAEGRLGDMAREVGSPEADGSVAASPIAGGDPCRSRSRALELPRSRRPVVNASATPA